MGKESLKDGLYWAIMITMTELDKYQGKLRVGTCSWKYDSWKGLVYSTDKKYGPYDYLPDYAKHFNTVEIDQWFWSLFPSGVRLPDPNIVSRYSDSVPDDFLFSVKAPNAITLTHFYSKQPKGSEEYANQPNPRFLDQDVLKRFMETLEPMKGKLGPIMFQFEYLNKKKMPSLQAFTDQLDSFLDQAPQGFDYAIEIRNSNYLTEAYFNYLKARKVGCILLDGYYMPPVGDIARMFDVHTGKYLVVRLHGPDRSKIEEETKGLWNDIVYAKDHGLHSAATIVKEALTTEITTIVNVNNHYEGCAPLTIQRLLDLVQ